MFEKRTTEREPIKFYVGAGGTIIFALGTHVINGDSK